MDGSESGYTFMSRADFVSAYSGSLMDATRNMLVANTQGTTAAWPLPDLWSKFLVERGYSGAVSDQLRKFLLGYLNVADTGQTIDDLWGQVSAIDTRILKPLSVGPGSVLTNINVTASTVDFVTGSDHGSVALACSKKLTGNIRVRFTVTSATSKKPAMRVGSAAWSGTFYYATIAVGANDLTVPSQGVSNLLWFGWAGAQTDAFTISNLQVDQA